MKKTLVLLVVLIAVISVFLLSKNAYSTHEAGVYVKNNSNITVRATISRGEHPTREEFDKYGKIIRPGEEKFLFETQPPEAEKGLEGFVGRPFKSVHVHDMNYKHLVARENVASLSRLVFYRKEGKYFLDLSK